MQDVEQSGTGGDKSRKPGGGFARLIGMTLTDDRTGHEIDAQPQGYTERRRPALRTVLGALVAVGLLIVLVALVVGGGGGGGSSSSQRGSLSTAVPAVNGPAETAGGQTAGGGGGTAGAPAFGTAGTTADARSAPLTAPVPAAPKAPAAPVDTITKVIKTGDIDLQVAKHQVPHTIDKLVALARLENGFVADSHSSEGEDPSGSVTLRVPVQAFDATITEVRTHIGGKVLQQQTAGEDVTSKYVDLQARLHSLQETRSTYERLLGRADTIGDILAVQARISDLQTQIEQLQGQLRVLNDQTTYGTLTVTVSEDGGPIKTAVVHHQSGMSKAFHRSLDRFVHGIEAIVGIIGPLLLVALIAALGYLVFRLVYRRFGPSAVGTGRAGPVGDDRLVGEQ